MDFIQFKDWIMLGLLGGLVYVIWDSQRNGIQVLQQIRESINELTIKLAVVIEKTENHEKRIERLEDNA